MNCLSSDGLEAATKRCRVAFNACRCRDFWTRLVIFCIVAMCHRSPAFAQPSAQLPLTGVTITADGKTVIDSDKQSVRIRDWESLEIRQSLNPSCQRIHDITLSFDQTLLAVAGGNPGEFAWVGLYAWPGMQLIWQREFAGDVAYATSFHPSEQILAVACHDSSVVLLDLKTFEIITVLSGHSRPVVGVTFLAEEPPLLATCSIDQTLRIWDVPATRLIRSLTNHTLPVTCLAIRPASGDAPTILASGSEDKTVRLWQPGIGRLIRFKRLASPVTSIAWTRDGAAILAGSRDGTVRMIHAETLEMREFPIANEAWVNAVSMHPTEPTALIGDSTGQLTKLELSLP